MIQHNNLAKAVEGDINAFHELFSAFKPELKSFLYRLLSDRDLVDDFYHDTFIKSFDKLASFQGNSSLKTWCFSIGTNLCLDYLRKSNRWSVSQKEDTKHMADNTPAIRKAFAALRAASFEGEFEMKEHIDFCFTCMTKTIAVEKQVAIILKDIYDFKVKEVAFIMNLSYANIKKILHHGRKEMGEIFDQKCALVNKNGVCHQCSELNGSFNPKQNLKEQLLKIKIAKNAEKGKRENLYKLRTELIKNINPLSLKGRNLHDFFMDTARYNAGEIKESSFFIK